MPMNGSAQDDNEEREHDPEQVVDAVPDRPEPPYRHEGEGRYEPAENGSVVDVHHRVGLQREGADDAPQEGERAAVQNAFPDAAQGMHVARPVLAGLVGHHGQALVDPLRLEEQQPPHQADEQRRDGELRRTPVEELEECAEQDGEHPGEKDAEKAVLHILGGDEEEPGEYEQVGPRHGNGVAHEQVERQKDRGARKIGVEKREHHDGRVNPFEEQPQRPGARAGPREGGEAHEHADQHADPMRAVDRRNRRDEPAALP